MREMTRGCPSTPMVILVASPYESVALGLTCAGRALPADQDSPPRYLATIERIDEIPGIGRHAAQTIIAEVRLSMSVFPTAGHLMS